MCCVCAYLIIAVINCVFAWLCMLGQLLSYDVCVFSFGELMVCVCVVMCLIVCVRFCDCYILCACVRVCVAIV